MTEQIKSRQVSPEFLRGIIEKRTPCERFLAKEGNKWIAVDNSTCDAWTEEFSSRSQAVCWLCGKFEVC